MTPIHTIPLEKINVRAEVLRVQAANLRVQADVIDALAAAMQITPDTDDLLDRRQRRELYPGLGSAIDDAIADGSLPACRGSKQRSLVRRSAIESWLESRPVAPRPPRSASAEPIDDLESWDRQVLGGGR